MRTEGAYPPYNFANDDGEVDGFERELRDELCRRAGLTCTWVTNEWNSITQILCPVWPDLEPLFRDSATFGGLFFATAIALARANSNWYFPKPAQIFIFVMRGSPLFIQVFIAYEGFVLIPKLGFDLNLGFVDITA